MQVKSIEITNVRGIQHLVASIGTLTVLEGPNGSGKSSFLAAVEAAFAGGHDPSLIRNGTEKAEIIITLDEFTIRRTITAKTSTVKISSADGSAVPKPETFLKTLCASFAFDPMKFVDSPKKERAAFLLSAMPVEFSYAEVSEIVGPEAKSCYDLERFNMLRQGKYDLRTDVRRDHKQTDGTINEWTQSLAATDDLDWAEHLNLKRAELNKTAGALTEAISEIEHAAYIKQEQIKTDRDAKIADLQRQIQVARDEAQTQIDSLRLNLETDKESNRAEATPMLDALKTEIATAEAMVSEQQRQKGARESIERLKVKRGDQAAEIARLDTVIDRLDALKAKKLEQLPIAGLEVRDGDIFVNGIPFDSVNMAQRMMLSLEIAGLKMGRLPLVIMDGAEQFDSERFELLKEALAGSDWQVVAARVSDGQSLEVVSAA